MCLLSGRHFCGLMQHAACSSPLPSEYSGAASGFESRGQHYRPFLMIIQAFMIRPITPKWLRSLRKP